jgi:branched-chain amino acid transport system ATP-binding protein
MSAALEISGLNAFYGHAHILADVAFEVEAGNVTALLGRNGAGKSTTFRAIMGLLASRSGAIRFEGRDIMRLATHEIARAGIGYVPEDRRIFTDLTVEENLSVGRRPPRPGAPTWRPEAIYALFPNLAEMRKRPGGRMSGGEQQMLTIARTLMGNPSLILLDEPSEGLAPKIVEQMAAAIVELKRQGLAILLSEQNLHFARLISDRATILEKGRVRFIGALAELEQRPDIRDAYLSV